MDEAKAADNVPEVPDAGQIASTSNGNIVAGDGVPEAAGGASASLCGKSAVQSNGSAADEGIGSAEKRKRKRREFFGDTDDFLKYGKGMRALRQQARPQTYDEAALDSMIDQHIGDGALSGRGRKKKPMDADKEVNVEAMIAASIGFPRESLTEEEIAAGVLPAVGGPDQNPYIVVRNHILAKWRENVNIWLDEATVMESIRSQHKALVSSAYKFLLQYGYINFGVAPAIKSAMRKDPTKGTVIIIGSGLAGLAAARQLLTFGHRVVILEGRQRPGGRVYTKKLAGDNLAAAADLGGSVVTGIHGNPLAVLARQLSYPLHKIREKCPLYQPNGQSVRDVVDSKVEAHFNNLLDEASKCREQMQDDKYSISLGTTLDTLRSKSDVAETEEERQLFDWHLANLEYANAGLLSNLSLAFWDQDDPYEMGGDHCFLAGGNVRLVAALAENLPIFYGTTVQCINYGEKGVQVDCGDQVFEGDMALCTVPLGVLKRRAIKFQPELPQRKLDAVSRLGFGLLNKVVMLFPRIFWGTDLDTFGHLTEHPSRRGEFFLFYSYASVSGGPLLLALIAGEAAINFEQMAPLDAVSHVLSILRGTCSRLRHALWHLCVLCVSCLRSLIRYLIREEGLNSFMAQESMNQMGSRFQILFRLSALVGGVIRSVTVLTQMLLWGRLVKIMTLWLRVSAMEGFSLLVRQRIADTQLPCMEHF